MRLLSTQSQRDDVILGTYPNTLLRSIFNLPRPPLTVPIKNLDTHMHVVGRTKKGKTGFLVGIGWQLVKLGQGLCFIDPHGDAANMLLRLLTSYRETPNDIPWIEKPENAGKLIYCHPGRKDSFIPMNVLASHDEPHIIVSNVVDAFRRTWKKELETAPQFINIAEHALHLLIEHNLSITELPKLIVNNDFRQFLVNRCQNEDIVDYFQNRFEAWGHREQVMRSEPVLNKVTRLTLNPNLKVMLGSNQNSLDFRQAMDSRSVVIISFGYPCDKDTKNLLGSIMLARIAQAAFSRGELEEHNRPPFFAVVDEFQKFLQGGSSDTIEEILSEARKFALYLIVAHQGLHQLVSKETIGAMEQAQIRAVFGSGPSTVKALMEEMHIPDMDRIKNEAPTDASHPYYESLLEQQAKFKEKMLGLKRRNVLIQLPETREPVQLKTMTLPTVSTNSQILEQIKARLLAEKGMPVAAGLQEIKERHLLYKQALLNRKPRAGRVMQNTSFNGRQRHRFQTKNVI